MFEIFKAWICILFKKFLSLFCLFIYVSTRKTDKKLIFISVGNNANLGLIQKVYVSKNGNFKSQWLHWTITNIWLHNSVSNGFTVLHSWVHVKNKIFILSNVTEAIYFLNLIFIMNLFPFISVNNLHCWNWILSKFHKC